MAETIIASLVAGAILGFRQLHLLLFSLLATCSSLLLFVINLSQGTGGGRAVGVAAVNLVSSELGYGAALLVRSYRRR